MGAFAPQELPEFKKTNLLDFDPAVGLDPPQQIRTAPWREMVAASRVPEEAENVAHDGMLAAKSPEL